MVGCGETTYYEVCEVIFFIAVSVNFFFAVDRECVVVVLGVPHLHTDKTHFGHTFYKRL